MAFLDSETKGKVYDYLLEEAKIQRMVRDCEIEGNVWDMEWDINRMADLGIIEYYHANYIIENILKRRS